MMKDHASRPFSRARGSKARRRSKEKQKNLGPSKARQERKEPWVKKVEPACGPKIKKKKEKKKIRNATASERVKKKGAHG